MSGLLFFWRFGLFFPLSFYSQLCFLQLALSERFYLSMRLISEYTSFLLSTYIASHLTMGVWLSKLLSGPLADI